MKLKQNHNKINKKKKNKLLNKLLNKQDKPLNKQLNNQVNKHPAHKLKANKKESNNNKVNKANKATNQNQTKPHKMNYDIIYSKLFKSSELLNFIIINFLLIFKPLINK